MGLVNVCCIIVNVKRCIKYDWIECEVLIVIGLDGVVCGDFFYCMVRKDWFYFIVKGSGEDFVWINWIGEDKFFVFKIFV